MGGQGSTGVQRAVGSNGAATSRGDTESDKMWMIMNVTGMGVAVHFEVQTRLLFYKHKSTMPDNG